MSTKKITELQLISSVTNDISIPGDNGIQTYRLTTQQLFDFILAAQNVDLSMLKNDIFTGLTAATTADDDYFPFVDVSDSNKTKKGLVGSFKLSPFRSVTSTDTATAADETIKLSGTSFTQTLPANGTVGKKLRIIHGGTSLSQVYTLATQGGANIGGVASGSYSLYTAAEVLDLLDDGTNWLITNHKADTAPAAYTPTFTGFGTPTSVDFTWWRKGAEIITSGRFICGTSTATGGSFSLPGTLVVHPSVFTTGTRHVGDWKTSAVNLLSTSLIVSPLATAIFFGYEDGSNSALNAINVNAILGSGNVLSVYARTPISGLQP